MNSSSRMLIPLDDVPLEMLHGSSFMVFGKMSSWSDDGVEYWVRFWGYFHFEDSIHFNGSIADKFGMSTVEGTLAASKLFFRKRYVVDNDLVVASTQSEPISYRLKPKENYWVGEFELVDGIVGRADCLIVTGDVTGEEVADDITERWPPKYVRLANINLEADPIFQEITEKFVQARREGLNHGEALTLALKDHPEYGPELVDFAIDWYQTEEN